MLGAAAFAGPGPGWWRSSQCPCRAGRFNGAKHRLDVKPFYRDGAYLVAVWEVVNEEPGNTPAGLSYPHKDYPGGAFTSFSVVAADGKNVYRTVPRASPLTGARSATSITSR